jgi:photosystem II stability/assembly factor-like uncharacterized protein
MHDSKGFAIAVYHHNKCQQCLFLTDPWCIISMQCTAEFSYQRMQHQGRKTFIVRGFQTSDSSDSHKRQWRQSRNSSDRRNSRRQ